MIMGECSLVIQSPTLTPPLFLLLLLPLLLFLLFLFLLFLFLLLLFQIQFTYNNIHYFVYSQGCVLYVFSY